MDPLSLEELHESGPIGLVLPSSSPDARAAELAIPQHGVVSWAQLRGFGLTPKAIRHRVANARLHVVHYKVYAVGHGRLTQDGRFMAAVLAGGRDAAVSHRAAAALW